MIEILEYKPINKNCLKAQVNIRIPKWGGFVIKRVKVFEKESSRWIMLPSEEYEKEGKKKYFSLIEFDTPEMNESFRAAFFKAYDTHISTK